MKLKSTTLAGRAGVAPSSDADRPWTQAELDRAVDEIYEGHGLDALEEPPQRISATDGPKDGAALQEGVAAGSGPQGPSPGARADLAAALWNYALHRQRTSN